MSNKMQLKMNSNMHNNTKTLQRPYNQEREPIEDLHKALVQYKGRQSGPPTLILQTSKLLTLPKELLGMVATRLWYLDAIALKNSCSTLYAVLDLPTLSGYFTNPKWHGSKAFESILWQIPGQIATWQPCHLCQRFRPPMKFAQKHRYWSIYGHRERWCLQCGLAAGYYAKGQVLLYSDQCLGRLPGKFCEECGNFMKFRDYCEMGFYCPECCGGSGFVPSWLSPWLRSRGGAHNMRCHDCLAGEYRRRYLSRTGPQYFVRL